MTTGGTQKKTTTTTPAMNPFAKAMAETESRAGKDKPASGNNSLLSEALAKAGGSLGQPGYSQEEFLYQQEKMREEHEKEMLRKKRHDQINPVDQHDVFEAKKENDIKEIEQLKQELALLILDVKNLDAEVEKTIMTQTVDPGERGTYYKNFFAKLRSWIMLIRQKLQSLQAEASQTWSKHIGSRKGKMSRRFGPGMGTKAVHDTLHHERSTAYSGA